MDPVSVDELQSSATSSYAYVVEYPSPSLCSCTVECHPFGLIVRCHRQITIALGNSGRFPAWPRKSSSPLHPFASSYSHFHEIGTDRQCRAFVACWPAAHRCSGLGLPCQTDVFQSCQS
ncbi:hypothetical protein TIFTF001_015345 [Ficus carica]|uniref:Uncharacterized protein n=1 Tax=Ficus carica TaxID=3494 RepID=A0AA88D7T3_FICCA|nr:hypothetical protein TIFTF001_015345 [Ficus carica]